jgi:hypothetical protein
MARADESDDWQVKRKRVYVYTWRRRCSARAINFSVLPPRLAALAKRGLRPIRRMKTLILGHLCNRRESPLARPLTALLFENKPL